VWHMNDLGWAWWLVTSVGMVAFWAFVIYAVVRLTRDTSPQALREQPREPPDELLKRRLAAGEISVEEFERSRDAMADAAPAEPHEPILR
jgi:uncharacterized membrane protein